jgi:phage terminase large subunit GpA-like protein
MPHLREILDCLGSEHPAEKVVAMMCSQSGKSSAALIWILYTIVYDPCSFLLVEPDVLRSEEFCKTRVDPMIEACPEARVRVSDPGKRQTTNTLHLKLFPGGKLVQVGANSPSGLASNPIKRAIWDERDRSKSGAKGEGAQEGLITARQTSYPDRKLFVCSSPTTTADGTIWKDWLESDQRHRMVRCPHCDGEIELVWEQIRWTAGDPASVYYECDLCGCEIREHQKSVMLGDDCGARWVAANPSSRIPGFTVSSLYLPLGWYGWNNLVADYEKAVASGDPEVVKAWVNTRLCRTFNEGDDPYNPPDGWDETRAEVWKARCPAGVAVLTCGVDVHEGRLEAEVCGWGLGETSWSVDYRILPGDPDSPAVWADLDAYIETTWPHESGGALKVMATCVDTGGHRTQAAYVQTTARLGRRVWGIRGSKIRESPIWPLKSRKAAGQYVWFEVGVHAIKDRVIPRSRLLPDTDAAGIVTGYPPGYCHVPAGRFAEWFEQMRSEVKRGFVLAGRQVLKWVQVRDRNEALDCRVYAYAALHSLYAAGHTLERLLDERLPSGQPVPVRSASAPRRESRMDRYRNGGRG